MKKGMVIFICRTLRKSDHIMDDLPQGEAGKGLELEGPLEGAVGGDDVIGFLVLKRPGVRRGEGVCSTARTGRGLGGEGMVGSVHPKETSSDHKEVR